MKRRTLIYGATGAAAGLAGATLAWWKFQPHAAVPAAEDRPGAAVSQASEAFWGLEFATPQGDALAMRGFRGKPLLVNFWATWCPPCVEELPLLDYFYQENKARQWQVLGLAVDQPSAVRTWLQARPLNFPVGMAGLDGTALSKSLGNLSGGLPFTVVFGASGGVLHRKLGKVLPEDLGQWAKLA